MRAKIVNTENRMMLIKTLTRLRIRGAAVPGICLVHGATGSGKTTALASAVAAYDAAFVRAEAMGCAGSLLDDICFELGVAAPYRNAAKFKAITSELKRKPRPLFVDEVDYLLRESRQLEMLRDLHDSTGVPIILIGMEEIEKKLLNYPQLTRRISNRLHFGPCDLADAQLLASELCEVEIEPELLAKMHGKAQGCIGLMVLALSLFEAQAKEEGQKRIGIADWGGQDMFLVKPKRNEREKGRGAKDKGQAALGVLARPNAKESGPKGGEAERVREAT